MGQGEGHELVEDSVCGNLLEDDLKNSGCGQGRCGQGRYLCGVLLYNIKSD